MKNKLTRTGFVKWLRAKHPRTRVGYSLNGMYSCPLAKFTGVAVGPVRYGALWEEKALPEWARDFVQAVDDVGGTNASPPITAKQALALLGE